MTELEEGERWKEREREREKLGETKNDFIYLVQKNICALSQIVDCGCLSLSPLFLSLTLQLCILMQSPLAMGDGEG